MEAAMIDRKMDSPAPDEVQAQKHSCAQQRLSAIEQGHPHHLRLDVQGHHWRHVQRNDSELHLLIVVQSWSIHGACGLLSALSQAALQMTSHITRDTTSRTRIAAQ